MKQVRNDTESMRLLYSFFRKAAFVLLKIIFRLSYTGIENIPKEGGVIVASNHASYTDPPCVGSCIPRETTFFAKKELFSVLKKQEDPRALGNGDVFDNYISPRKKPATGKAKAKTPKQKSKRNKLLK